MQGKSIHTSPEKRADRLNNHPYLPHFSVSRLEKEIRLMKIQNSILKLEQGFNIVQKGLSNTDVLLEDQPGNHLFQTMAVQFEKNLSRLYLEFDVLNSELEKNGTR